MTRNVIRPCTKVLEMLTFCSRQESSSRRNMTGTLGLLDARYPHGYGLLSSIYGSAAHFGGSFALAAAAGNPYGFNFNGYPGDLRFQMEGLLSSPHSRNSSHGQNFGHSSDKHSLKSPGMSKIIIIKINIYPYIHK